MGLFSSTFDLSAAFQYTLQPTRTVASLPAGQASIGEFRRPIHALTIMLVFTWQLVRCTDGSISMCRPRQRNIMSITVFLRCQCTCVHFHAVSCLEFLLSANQAAATRGSYNFYFQRNAHARLRCTFLRHWVGCRQGSTCAKPCQDCDQQQDNPGQELFLRD